MPRDASGNYTLPSGNPVVTGTTIDSTWANNTMNDLATEVQDSLSRSGNGGMLVPLEFSDGTAAAPGITFTNETSSGFYRAATNDVRVSVAGSDRAQFRSNATDPFRVWSGGAWKLVLNENSTATITGTWTFSGSLTIPEASVTAHEAALSITESQISNLGTTAVLDSDIGVTVEPLVQTLRKTADLQRTSSSNTADNHLTGFSYAANTSYRITGYLYVVEGDVGDAGGGFNAGFINFTAATVVGATSFIAVADSPGVAGGGVWSRHIESIRNVSGDVIDGDQSNPQTAYGVYVEGTFRATTSGTMDFGWALQTADAQGTTLKEGSYISLVKLSV